MNLSIKFPKVLILILATTIVLSCSTSKRTQEALNSGNYASAINTSISKLSSNKTKKGNQKYIYMLEEAFSKNSARELKEIDFLLKEGNGANYERVYNTYIRLNTIQNRIKPLMPLHIIEEGRKAEFSFNDYTNDILSSKEQLSSYLYDNATNLVKTASTKFDFRKAYNDFVYLDKLSPGYKDTKTQIEEAYENGIDYVKVKSYNASDKVIPKPLEDDLLNFNAYGLNDLWTKYHTNPQKGTSYNYENDFRICKH